MRTWWRMMMVLARLAGPSWLTPWRSPFLRWRMETYGVCDEHGRLLHAADLTPRIFLTFLIRRRAALLRFARWAATL